MCYTLLIVDMQKSFYAALDKTVQEHCKKAIRRAIKSRAAIIFVEYVDHGPTLPCLTNLVKNYKRVFYTTKKEWDGSRHSIDIVKNGKLPISNFKVCGVYTDCCVAATVQGLAMKNPKSRIEVIPKACGGTDINSHKEGINRMLQFNNVRAWNRVK